MGPQANQSWAADNVPPSISDSPLSAFGCQA
jgi:hypothetical protein